MIPRANSIDIQFRLVLGDRRLRRDVAFITAAPPDSVITEHRINDEDCDDISR